MTSEQAGTHLKIISLTPRLAHHCAHHLSFFLSYYLLVLINVCTVALCLSEYQYLGWGDEAAMSSQWCHIYLPMTLVKNNGAKISHSSLTHSLPNFSSVSLILTKGKLQNLPENSWFA